MNRFEFRLQAVLTLRQRAEQEALEIYGQAIRHRAAVAEQLRVQELDLCEHRRRWLNEMTEGCPAIRAAQTLTYCHTLEERRNQADRELQQAEIRLSEASQRMLSARQHREAVENLFHQQQAAHEALVRLEEQKMLDDLVGRRAPISVASRLIQPAAWN
jgi:flagellar export protein FliJ